MLSAKNIRTKRPAKKLDHRFLGPFSIEEAVGKQAYRLKLPQTYSRIHPVFHVSLLEPYFQREGADNAPPEPLPVEGQDEWEVEEILDMRIQNKGTFYLVRWKGFSPDHDSWQPETDLTHAQEKVQQYLSIHGAATPTISRRGRPKGQGRPRRGAQRRLRKLHKRKYSST